MLTNMLAARLTFSEQRLVVERVPVPELRPGHVLIKVSRAGRRRRQRLTHSHPSDYGHIILTQSKVRKLGLP